MADSFIVGDAGGTSTQWRVVIDGEIHQVETIGFNAYTHSLSDFESDIKSKLSFALDRSIKVHLYAAGVDTPDQKNEVEAYLLSTFIEIEVENDLVGVARSLCGNNPGYVGILGTGSNACFYNGQKVDKVSASLGYILGDEGSGAYLGKKLIQGIYRGMLSAEIIDQFNSEFNITLHEIIQRLYTEPKPNYFLASFSKFIRGRMNDRGVYHLVYDSFIDFFRAFFHKKTHDLPVHFSGSIAFYYSNILRQVGQDLNFTIGNIVKSPIAGLVLYHQSND